MINVDEHGNRFIIMAGDGTRVPLEQIPLTIRVDAVSHGMILPVNDALAVERAAATHWFAKYQEAQTTIADLRAQLLGHD